MSAVLDHNGHAGHDDQKSEDFKEVHKAVVDAAQRLAKQPVRVINARPTRGA